MPAATWRRVAQIGLRVRGSCGGRRGEERGRVCGARRAGRERPQLALSRTACSESGGRGGGGGGAHRSRSATGLRTLKQAISSCRTPVLRGIHPPGTVGLTHTEFSPGCCYSIYICLAHGGCSGPVPVAHAEATKSQILSTRSRHMHTAVNDFTVRRASHTAVPSRCDLELAHVSWHPFSLSSLARMCAQSTSRA